jgi:uncharacterized membrane protein YtjA (UPF0391 family)
MLRLALLFLLIAILATLFGFPNVAVVASGAAQILVLGFLALLAVVLIVSALQGRPRDLV